MPYSLSAGPAQSAAESVPGVLTITLAGVAAGHGVVIAWLWAGDTGDFVSVTCAGETIDYTTIPISGPNANISNTKMGMAFIAAAATSGTKTINVNFNSILGDGGVAVALAVNGAIEYDTSAYAEGNSAAPSASLIGVTANALIFAISSSRFSGGASAGSGYTRFDLADRHWYDESEYMLDSGTAGNKTVDMAISAEQWGIKAASFRVPGGSTPGNASGDIGSVAASAPAGSASSTRAVTITLKNNAGAPLVSVSRRFWTRNTLDAAAADGGAGGLAVTCDSSGVFALTGLAVLAGPGWLTYKDPSDDLNCHTVPVTFI